MDYSTMPAGPEMDAAVAVKVMGLCKHDLCPGHPRGWCCRICGARFEGPRGVHTKPYSVDIAPAFEVVEKVALCWAVNITGALTGWYVTFGNVEQPNRTYMGYAGTVSLAICRAALAAVEAETAT